MLTPQSRSARRGAAVLVLAGTLLVAGCSDDAEPGDTVPDTLAPEEVIDQAPGVSSSVNDVTNGAGEGGNPGDTPTGTAAP